MHNHDELKLQESFLVCNRRLVQTSMERKMHFAKATDKKIFDLFVKITAICPSCVRQIRALNRQNDRLRRIRPNYQEGK